MALTDWFMRQALGVIPGGGLIQSLSGLGASEPSNSQASGGGLMNMLLSAFTGASSGNSGSDNGDPENILERNAGMIAIGVAVATLFNGGSVMDAVKWGIGAYLISTLADNAGRLFGVDVDGMLGAKHAPAPAPG